MTKEIKKEWDYKKRKLVIIWINGHFCAYAETKLKEVSYSENLGSYETSPESNISAHGGITYSGNLPYPKYEDKWFFGIDFAHYGDYVEGMSHYGEEKIWTLEEVEKETEDMLDSILKYEKKYNKFKRAFSNFEREIKKIQKGLIK